MRTRVALLAGLGAAAVLALPLAAQQPGAGPMAPRMGMGPAGMGMIAAGPRAPGAEFLLAASGALKLSDQQVTRLAAIARRTAARREAVRASFDSLRAQRAPGMRMDSAARRAARTGPLAQAFRNEREQTHADLRDALAVLTPDQLAQAWEMIARRGARPARPGAQIGAARFMMRNRALQDMRTRRAGAMPPPAPGTPRP
ncbi:MAG TPA: hypothetical protein VF832_12800 [Longimicrobiales bacterium]